MSFRDDLEQLFWRALLECKWMMDVLFRLAAISVIRSRRAGVSDATSGILVLSTDGLGDFVLRINFLRSLERSFPGVTVYHIVRKEVAEFHALQRPSIRCLVVDHERYRRNYFYRWSFLKSIPRLNWQYVIYPVYSRSSVGDEIASVVPSGKKIAFGGDDACMSEPLRNRNLAIYDQVLQCEPWCPEQQKYSLLYSAVCIPEHCQDLYPEISLQDPHEHNEVIESGKPFAMIFPAASTPLRQWSAESVVKCSHRLHHELGVQIVLAGAVGDEAYINQLASAVGNGVIAKTGTTLSELTTMISRATFVIGMESGPAHLAIALGRPTVVLVAGGQFGRHFTDKRASFRGVYHLLECYRCNWKCPFPEPYCMTQIPVEVVVQAVRGVLENQ